MKKNWGYKTSKKICAVTIGATIMGNIFFTGCGKEEGFIEGKIESEQNTNQTAEKAPTEVKVIKSENERYKELAEKIEDFGDTQSLMGTFCVATDDDIIYAGGWNDMEVDGVTPVGIDTTYEIGSNTKMFTATAILQQVEAGNLSLDDTLERFFPEYLNAKDVTISQLLHMKSGIPEYRIEGLIELKKQYGPDVLEKYESGENRDIDIEKEVLNYLYQQDVVLESEDFLNYSDSNYFLLASILEKVSGMSYEEYIRKNIFEKCDMNNSTAGETGHITSVPHNDMSYNSGIWYKGSGDIHSTVIDVLLFDRMVMNEEILGEELSTYLINPDEKTNYACGVWANNGGFRDDGATLGEMAFNYVFVDNDGNNYYIIFQGTAINVESMVELLRMVTDDLNVEYFH